MPDAIALPALPPLPEPNVRSPTLPTIAMYYNADILQAFAREAVMAERERLAKLVIDMLYRDDWTCRHSSPEAIAAAIRSLAE